MTELFLTEEALAINKARLDHLASLPLNLDNRTVLEVGAGIGLLTGFFEERGCQVVSTEGREENVREHRQRYPHRDVRVFDLENPEEYKQFDQFEVVFCYGTLYHLSNPAFCLEALAKLCTDLFLLETMVYGPDDNVLKWAWDCTEYTNQGLCANTCRPGRNWVIRELGKHYWYVYHPELQPRNCEFPTVWPSTPDNARAVFVGSRGELDL